MLKISGGMDLRMYGVVFTGKGDLIKVTTSFYKMETL